jgi:hypothetical protein
MLFAEEWARKESRNKLKFTNLLRYKLAVMFAKEWARRESRYKLKCTNLLPYKLAQPTYFG